MGTRPVRVLVVDDTVVYRKIVSDILADTPGVEVVGTASNGKVAIQKLSQLNPDLLTLDLEMPEKNGLQVLDHLRETNSRVGAIMLSAFTDVGAKSTVAALERGAFDFVLKPSGTSINNCSEELKTSLRSKIDAFAKARRLGGDLSSTAPATPSKTKPIADESTTVSRPAGVQTTTKTLLQGRPRVVALGISTGGPEALSRMIPKLPGDLSVPVLIVQHMPPMFTKSLADSLNTMTSLTVSEAVDGEIIEPHHVYIAPGGKQMKLGSVDGGLAIQITDDPPERSCRPSVDYLFRSVAEHYGAKALGVIMTGMGDDGTLGSKLMKRRGATIMVQDEASCVVFGMPKQLAEDGTADIIAPLDQIAEQIAVIVKQGELVCR